MRGVRQGYRLVVLLYSIAAELLANFINNFIKRIQKADHEIIIVNVVDATTMFLRDITCFNRIQVILKLYEDASSSKLNF